VINLKGSEHVLTNHTATRTVDGYYRLQLPLVSAKQAVGIQLGKLFSWVQIEAIEATPLADLAPTVLNRRVWPLTGIPDGMEQEAPDLYRVSPGGLLFVSLPTLTEPMLLSVAFRPICRREEPVALRTAA